MVLRKNRGGGVIRRPHFHVPTPLTIIPADQMVDQLLLVKDQIYTLPVEVMELYNKLE